MTKRCRKCKKRKSTKQFWKNSRLADGLQTYCKQCIKAATDKLLAANPNYYVEVKRRYRDKDPARYRALNRKRRIESYGLTVAEFTAMEQKAKGLCMICGRKPEGKLHIDHCHTTLKVRGLLCGHCNSALGLFQDDVEVIRKAARYLSRFT